ncbi:uncharacterized protein LOC126986118 [Eriocheir sinensis]|uniref:uncharacterized protein LOC126986118 n=1 Tax=Eriocheir sinensis TaxID=95602 RepID=UPI0021C5B590|nr:uncharacterized protein LOC126986118 [Eriocheir sinensis]
MDEIGRLTLDSAEEEEEVVEVPVKRAGTPTLPWGTEYHYPQHHHHHPQHHLRPRRKPLLRSISAEPWTTATDTAAALVRDSPRPGRKLTRESSKRKHKTTTQDSEEGRRGCRGACCVLLSCSLATTVLLCLLTLDPSHLTTTITTTCTDQPKLALPLNEFRTQLRKNLVGQSEAIEALTHSLGVFATSATQRTMVLWFAGWEGSGKTLTINILRSVLRRTFRIQSLLSHFLPHTPEGIQDRVGKLLTSLDPCGPNLVIIDGWDEREDAQIPLAILDSLLKGLSGLEATRGNVSKVLVVLSGTVGAREVWEHFRGGGERVERHVRGSEWGQQQDRESERDLRERRGSDMEFNQGRVPEKNQNHIGETEGDLNQRIGPERHQNLIQDAQEDLNQRRESETVLGYREEGGGRNQNHIEGIKMDLNQRIEDLNQNGGDLDQGGGLGENLNQRGGLEGDLNQETGNLKQRKGLEEDLNHRKDELDQEIEAEEELHHKKDELKEKTGTEVNFNDETESEKTANHHQQLLHHHLLHTHPELTRIITTTTSTTDIITVIPFLPLDATHIKLCIVRELIRIHKEEILLDQLAMGKLTQEVLLRTDWLTEGGEEGVDGGSGRWVIARHGCKRVGALIGVLLVGV